MQKTVFRGLSLGAAILAGMLSGPAARGDIAIQFVGGGGGIDNTPMDPSEVAGAVVRQMNWNPAQKAAGGDIALMDDMGLSSGATLEYYSSANTWAVPITDVPGDIRLMRGYLDTTATSTTVVVISGIPYAKYDVYLYSRGDGTDDRQGLFFVNDLEGDNGQTCFNPGGDFFIGTYVLGQNYLVFSAQTSSELVIFATPDPNFNNGAGGFRAPLNGVQIVNTSGPDVADGVTELDFFQNP
jgi:hypothetical protein